MVDIVHWRDALPSANLLLAFPSIRTEVQPIHEAAVERFETHSVFTLNLVPKAVPIEDIRAAIDDLDLEPVQKITIQTLDMIWSPVGICVTAVDTETSCDPWRVIAEPGQLNLDKGELLCFMYETRRLGSRLRESRWSKELRCGPSGEGGRFRIKGVGMEAEGNNGQSSRQVRVQEKKDDLMVIVNVCLREKL